jgi:hypothetical protein
MACVLAAVLLLHPWSSMSFASDGQRGAVDARCGCVPADEVDALAGSIRAAASLDEARALATGPTSRARTALAQARWLIPGTHSDLDDAYERLVAYESRVESADTPEVVAAELEDMLLERAARGRHVESGTSGHASAFASVSPDADIHVDLDDGCDYTSGEIAAIVLGFVLGIIPGIILLFVLC